MSRGLDKFWLVFVPLAMCITSAAGCDLCGNKIGQDVQSPDGKLRAVAFERDCGATTGFATHVSILKKSEKLPNEGGNVFVASGDLRIRLKWQSATALLVTYPSGQKIHLKRSQEAGVAINYEEAPSH